MMNKAEKRDLERKDERSQKREHDNFLKRGIIIIVTIPFLFPSITQSNYFWKATSFLFLSVALNTSFFFHRTQ